MPLPNLFTHYFEKTMFERIMVCILLSISLGFAAPTNTLADLADAKTLANSCVACHGPNGSSLGPASPSIAGLSRNYFIKVMNAYKDEEISATIMSRIAKGYSTVEIDRLAEFFSKQTFVSPGQVFDSKKAEKGKKIHKKYCNKCHEEGGSLAADDAGILAGQWSVYLRYTLQDFLQGKRSMDKKKKQQLDKLMKQQGDDGLDKLIHYYMSQ